MKGIKGAAGWSGSTVGGVSYIRWGRSTCPIGVTNVYSGRTGSSFAGHKGGAANYICLPNNPEYSRFIKGVQGKMFMELNMKKTSIGETCITMLHVLFVITETNSLPS